MDTLFNSHMQAVSYDDFSLLADSFINFTQKITAWRLTWPEHIEGLSASKNLHITLGRALSILNVVCPMTDKLNLTPYLH